MTELSSGNLFRPLLVDSAQVMRLDDIMWPSYQRVTDEKGGDLHASFVVDSALHNLPPTVLERWFIDWIGHHFEESYAGRDVFHGIVNTLRLHVGGVVLVHSLDQMFNSIKYGYQADSVSAASITSAGTDANSVARYGTKEEILEGRSYITQTHAEAKRDEFLSRRAWPLLESGDVTIGTDATAILEVYIEGYISTLDWVYWNQANEDASSKTLSAHLTDDLLVGLDYVSAGDIDTISTSITTEADYITILRRIDDLLADSAYYYGCFGGRKFDAKARDTTSIKYRRKAYGQRGAIYRGGRPVPAPLVKPGGIIWTEDIYAGRPVASTLLYDPRASWIAQVEYSINGVQLKNGEQPDSGWDAGNQALIMAKELNMAAIQEPKDYIVDERNFTIGGGFNRGGRVGTVRPPGRR